MAPDRTLINRPNDRLTVSLRKRGRQDDLDSNPVHALARGVSCDCDREPQPLSVEVTLLAEAQRVETRARPDRGEEEIEWRRGCASASLNDGLIRADPDTLVQGIDAQTSREPNIHGWRFASPAPDRMM